jgi:hypothetical protein
MGADPKIVRAWRVDGQVLFGLADVGGELDDYRAHVQSLVASLAPCLRGGRASFGCSPPDAVEATGRQGTLVYERDAR